MRIRILFVGLVGMVLFVLAGCKHAEKVVIEKKLKPVSVRRVVRMVNENELTFNTLSVKRVGLTLNNDGKVTSVRGMYKIRKDSVIQVSAQKLTIPVGKLELGTDSFRVVYHIGKIVMTGMIQEISDLIGYDIDYQTVQAIMSNQMQSIKQDQEKNQFKDYVLEVEDNMYKISSVRERRFRKFADNEERYERFMQRKDEKHMVKQDIFVDPDIFVVRKEIYHDLSSDRIITIVFSDFQPVMMKWFPGNIRLSLSGKEKLEIEVELSKVTIDDEKDFGFSVPSKYKRESLKKNNKLN